MLKATDLTQKKEVRRDRFGRYVVVDADGNERSYTRTTTVAKVLEDRWNLEKWGQRMVLKGLADSPDLLALAQGHDPEADKKTYDDLASQCMDRAKTQKKANLGTALHRFTEQLDAGTHSIDQMPPEWRSRLALYQKKIREAGIHIEPDHIEQVVLDDDHEVAGMVDRFGIIPDGTRRVVDLKTGANLSFSWLSIAIQLAVYANHTATFDVDREERSPRIDCDLEKAIVVHLPATSDEEYCHLYELDIAAGYQAYMCALQVREWRKQARNGFAKVWEPDELMELGVIAPVKPEPGITDVEWIRERIRVVGEANGVADLVDRWPANVPQPLPSELDTAQVNALAAALDHVEGIHEIPFGLSRPSASK